MISFKLAKALQVHQLQLCNPKMTKAKACANVGIDAKTYRKWIANQKDALQEFENIRNEIEWQSGHSPTIYFKCQTSCLERIDEIYWLTMRGMIYTWTRKLIQEARTRRSCNIFTKYLC